ncbi:Hypothetical predicted protein, partial [Pelobates cultripes]
QRPITQAKMADAKPSSAPQDLMETTLTRLEDIFKEVWLKLSHRQAEMGGRSGSIGPSHHLPIRAEYPTSCPAQQIESANMSQKITNNKS